MALLLTKLAFKSTAKIARIAQLTPLVGTTALLLGNVYSVYFGVRWIRDRILEKMDPEVDHLEGMGDGVGCYGPLVFDKEFVAETELDQAEVVKLEVERGFAETFDPLEKMMHRSRSHRALVRYWLDRLYELNPRVQDDEGDVAALRIKLARLMRAKGYRTNAIAALADTVVALAVIGTQERRIPRAMIRNAKKQSFLEWLLRIKRFRKGCMD